MTRMLVLREQLKKFYGKYEVYLVPVLKFSLALLAFLLINTKIGYMQKINTVPVALILALLCSFLPMNTIIVVGAGIILAHLYELSMECALIVAVLLILMFVLYFRFSPKDTIVVLLTPICFALKIPYVIPLAMGLVGTPTSVISAGCGVVVYYTLHYISSCSTALSALDAENMLAKFRYVIDGLLANKEMFVAVAAFAVTIIMVYLIRRLNVDHAWTIAMIAGGLTNILIFLIGDLMFTTNTSIFGLLFGSVISFAIVKVIQFFVFNVDYTRTERVQFEDDEYYYFVKAVPKNTIAIPDKTIKKVSGNVTKQEKSEQ